MLQCLQTGNATSAADRHHRKGGGRHPYRPSRDGGGGQCAAPDHRCGVRPPHACASRARWNSRRPNIDVGIDFLNRIGQATHDSHNEGILFADAIGFSTLVCLLNNGNARRHRDRLRLARSVLAREFAADRKRRLDRPLADAGPANCLSPATSSIPPARPIAGVDSRRLAILAGRSLREPG